MGVSFEIKGRDAAARLGKFTTDHGVVNTPTLLPVLNPNIAFIAAKEMKQKFGTEMVITNSYVIRKSEKLREIALAEGVHKVIDWDGPVMTDSGTFQMYVYGKVQVEPDEIVAFQRDIGVDVGTILDIFSTPDRTLDEARADWAETLARAKSAAAIKGGMALNGTVQGGIYPELRRQCAREYRDVGVDFHAIGGVVPMMERQMWPTLVDAVVAAKQELDPSRPTHLFGAGHPQMFALAALLGCDFFDSSSYAKYAKDGRMMYEDGTRHLADLIDNPCACETCSKHTPAELRALPEAERERALGIHNLAVSFGEIRRVREAIRAGRLWELATARCKTHPTLADGFRRALDHAAWFETLEPLSKPNAFFHTGAGSGRRPEVLRTRSRLLSRWRPRGDVFLLPAPAQKPVAEAYPDEAKRVLTREAVAAARSAFGPVPFELDGTYPFSQSVEPTALDAGTRQDIEDFHLALANAHGVRVIDWNGDDLLERFEHEETPPRDPLVERVRAICDYQFGAGAADALLAGTKIDLRVSHNTGKVRNVTVDGEHVLSLRAEDGFFTLKIAGARRLHKAFEFPRLRIVVGADSADFNRQGKNVFAQFVEKWDPALRPGEECLIVTWADELVACGQMHLAPSELGFFKKGLAVHTRDGTASPKS
ncbi:MAG TPA: tRNA guanosine(15) transglycosylase TgtA [Candidatus Thermoplasmatota archaeon]|nr:tRNA guanosine(15) transglycosylase TgtA [Candidatus Thermoplasmatota archaeon]